MSKTNKMYCRDCDGHGYTAEPKATWGCCGNADESGDCCNQPIEEYEPEQVQCDTCKGSGNH